METKLIPLMDLDAQVYAFFNLLSGLGVGPYLHLMPSYNESKYGFPLSRPHYPGSDWIITKRIMYLQLHDGKLFLIMNGGGCFTLSSLLRNELEDLVYYLKQQAGMVTQWEEEIAA